MTILNGIYCALGLLFIVLGIACLYEKYRTVRGAQLLPARILRCDKQGTAGHKGSGGYHFVVEFNDNDGYRHTARTNDSFWFSKEKKEGAVIEIWYNPQNPVVERKSIGTELLSAAVLALGALILLWLGFEIF